LYEGIDLKKDGGLVGLITYMRTDSVRVSPDAVTEVRSYIEERYGARHLPDKPNVFKSRKDAQEAHEAIRPTSLELSPDKVRKHLSDEQFKLYRLIWDRFVASQMAPAVYDQTGVDIEATPSVSGPRHKTYGLRATGKVLKFSGWLEQYSASHALEEGTEGARRRRGRGGRRLRKAPAATNGHGHGAGAAAAARAADDEEGLLPAVAEGEELKLATPPGVITEQKFTQPPARFKRRLARARAREARHRSPQHLRRDHQQGAGARLRREAARRADEGDRARQDSWWTVLVSTNLDFIDPSFTAKMEEELDDVQAGKLGRKELLSRFYGRFREVLDGAKKGKRWAPEPEPTEFKCDDCGSMLNKRWSKNGWFLGCSAYPKCKFTRDLGKDGNAPRSRA
jgi:DNA topoisomerase-1